MIVFDEVGWKKEGGRLEGRKEVGGKIVRKVGGNKESR